MDRLLIVECHLLVCVDIAARFAAATGSRAFASGALIDIEDNEMGLRTFRAMADVGFLARAKCVACRLMVRQGGEFQSALL